MGAKVLIVGSEGRAHSLGWKIAQSPLVEKVYFAPGNGGTGQVGENLDIGVGDFEKLADFAEHEKIELTVVSPEQPLADGIVDFFEKRQLKIFGPSAAASQIESSKVFSTNIFEKYGVPYPASIVAKSYEEAQHYIDTHKFSEYVIKADGLAAGKGVILPESEAEAQTAIDDVMKNKIFGDSGNQIVFQERLKGQEVSAFALSDGERILMLPFCQDHKQIFEGDKGPNTGGVGAYSPLPFMTDEMAERIKTEIMQPVVDGLRAEGIPYKGVLYGGLFVSEVGPKVIEFNCRFGDPECQVLMRMVNEDIYPLLLQCAMGQLEQDSITTTAGAAANIVLCSGGYPGDYQTGFEVQGLDKITNPDVVVFHAGTKKENSKVLTSGGRVLNVTAHGENLKSALSKAYSQIGENGVHFDGMYYRKDIGHRVL